MHVIRICCLFLTLATLSCSEKSNSDDLQEYAKRAEQNQVRFELPSFPKSAEEVEAQTKAALSQANTDLDRVAALSPADIKFESTFVEMERIFHRLDQQISVVALLSETSTDSAVRERASQMMEQVGKWGVDVEHREDLYLVAKALEKKNPQLQGASKKLYLETLRSYRRSGMHLPRAVREKTKAIKKTLTELSNQFRKNINESRAILKFSKAELDGVPEDYLKKAKKIKDSSGQTKFIVNAHITWEYFTVLRNATREETRKKVFVANSSRTKKTNIPILKKMVPLRAKLAYLLGYSNWADYKTEVKMVKNGKTAMAFLSELRDGLEPLFQKEMAQVKQLKIQDTGNPQAQVFDWDARYYYNQIQKQQYSVDQEALKVYFPFDATLAGMFQVYQQIFGLTFKEVVPPYRWHSDVRLFLVVDSQSDRLLGAFYLDPFPREGKYNHFASFGLVDGGRREDGRYQAPVVSLVCNFPAAGEGTPSLLLHDHVETLFHEFGHALHSILTRAEYASQAGTSVPRDFVEAPSQMLENWVWDFRVLKTFAKDYRNSSKVFPEATLKKMREAKKAGSGRANRYQITLGMIDLDFHSRSHPVKNFRPAARSRALFQKNYLPQPRETAWVGGFGHLMGYDAGYYGYLWSKSISEDMASVFEKSKDRFFDSSIGMRLRREVYEPGDSRDVNQSIKMFLGRQRSLKPFLNDLGIAQEK